MPRYHWTIVPRDKGCRSDPPLQCLLEEDGNPKTVGSHPSLGCVGLSETYYSQPRQLPQLLVIRHVRDDELVLKEEAEDSLEL